MTGSAIEATLRQAFAFHREGRLAQAEPLYRAVIAEAPHTVEALHFLGVIAFRRGRLAEAERLIDHALALKPDYAEAHYDRANVLRALNRAEEAVAAYDEALALRPDYVEALNNRGGALMDARRPAVALESFERALALRPGHVKAHCNRGSALMRLDRLEAALAAYNSALALDSRYATAWFGRANALKELKRLDQALESFAKALALQPEAPELRWNQSLCHLLAGDFTRGFAAYEWRWQAEPLKAERRNFPRPLWLGDEALGGRTILLHAEQGYGDTLQFCRYVPLVAARGGRVVLEVQRPLKALLAGLEGVAEIVARGEALPSFDLHCPLLSLPLAFKTTLATVPARIPYVGAPPDRIAEWRARLDGTARPRIGLAWAGNPSHRNDRNRSLDPACLGALLQAAEGATFVSLQKTLRDADRAWLDAHPEVLPLGAALDDFADTAALLGLMDLVIAADTAAAHLAGAMARPVWLLLPYVGLDWRWLTGREDSPWYPTARLFRQPRIDDWASALEAVAAALRGFVRNDVRP